MGSLFPSAAFGSRHPKGTPLPIDLGKSMFNSRGKTDKKNSRKATNLIPRRYEVSWFSVNVSGRVFSFGGFVGALLTLNRQQYWNNGDGQVKSFWEGHNEWQGRCWGCRPPQKKRGGQTTVPHSTVPKTER